MSKFVKEQLSDIKDRLARAMKSCAEEEEILLAKLEDCRKDHATYLEDWKLTNKLFQAIDIINDINKDKPT